MPNQPVALDRIFQALADPTRRGVLNRLSQGPASVSELAKPFEIALPSFLQHLQVLEDSGLIHTRKIGRIRTCELEAQSLTQAEEWIATQRAVWENRLDRLEAYVDELQARGQDEHGSNTEQR